MLNTEKAERDKLLMKTVGKNCQRPEPVDFGGGGGLLTISRVRN